MAFFRCCRYRQYFHNFRCLSEVLGEGKGDYVKGFVPLGKDLWNRDFVIIVDLLSERAHTVKNPKVWMILITMTSINRTLLKSCVLQALTPCLLHLKDASFKDTKKNKKAIGNKSKKNQQDPEGSPKKEEAEFSPESDCTLTLVKDGDKLCALAGKLQVHDVVLVLLVVNDIDWDCDSCLNTG